MTTAAVVPASTLCRATVVFVDILGADRLVAAAGIERAYGIVTGCLRLLSAIARRQGGVVDQYLSDALMAVFGYPIEAPDAEIAAVAAAVDMLAAAERWSADAESPVPLVLRIGINTGSMVAGDVRGRIAREFAVMGDVVNTAARLKDVGAPGGIHVGPETHAAARAAFAFETLEPVELRGKARRVPVFRVVPAAGARAEPSDGAVLPDAPLLGRADELAMLHAALEALRAGRGGAIALVAAEGLGKSRLLAEITAEAARAGIAVLRSSGGTVPARAALAARSAAGALVITVDDLQRADAGAWTTLADAMAALRDLPILWLLAWRPDAAAAPVERLRAAMGAALVERMLRPLGADDADRLIDAGGASLAPPVRARIVARAEGNPARLLLGALLAPAVETELAIEATSGERGSEAERRRVTVLFADLSGFTRLAEQLEPGEAFRIVGGCLRVLHEVAERHGGTVDKYLGDCVMAIFGVPVAIEDAPRAAVNAAIEMLRRVEEYNTVAVSPVPLGVHVGINTGLGIAGDVSGPLLREFALMGEAVNVASRLKDLAPRGRVWVGAETARLAPGFAWRSVTLPVRDGVATAAHELASAQAQMHRPRIGTGETLFAALVGREAELAVLRAAVADVVAGTGGVIGVVGEPGLGKSRLLAELAASSEAADVRWAEGRAVAMGRRLHLHVVADLLRSLLALGDAVGASAAAGLATAVEPLLGAAAAETAPLLANVLGLPLAATDASRLADMPGDALERLQRRALHTLVAAVARTQPLVIVLEDVHWADRSSLDMLGATLRLAAELPVLVVWAARPDAADTTAHWAAAARATLPPGRATELRLRPLARDDTRRLLATLFASGGLPGPLRDRIETHAGGNPLYVEELLRSLVEQDAVERLPDGLRMRRAIDTLAVPATVQEVVLARVDRLAPAQKQLLQLAAVAGQRVPAPVLADLVEDRAARDAGVAQLVAAEMLVPDAGGVAFRHRVIQEVTYASILETRRRALHEQVARVVDVRLRDAPGYHALLAHHYGLAEDDERAEEHLLRAGDDAARAGAPAEALELFHESSRRYLARHAGGGDPETRAMLHHRLAGAYFHRGELEDASRHFNEALALRGELVPRGRAALGLGLARALLVVLGRLYTAGVRRARRPATARDVEVIGLMFDRSRAETVAEPARFLFDSLEMLRKLSGVDPATVPGAGGLYAGAIGVFSYAGVSFDVGRRFLALAAPYVDAESVPETFLYRMMTFAHHFLAGDWDARHEIPGALLDAAVRHGQLWDVSTHLGLESFKRLLQGRWADAEAHLARLAAIEDAYAHDLARSNRHAAEAFLHTERRELDAALAAARTYLTEHHEPLLNLQALGTMVKVHVLRGELDEARAAQAKADALLATGRVPPWHFGFVARGRLLLGTAAAGRGRARVADLRRAARDALWAAARVAWLRPEIYRAVGAAEAAAGRVGRARAWGLRALAEADRLGMTPEAARARDDLHRLGS